MIETLIIFAISLAVLIKGADFMVDSAARVAKLFGISDFMIGLTVVAIGTSLPELAASLTATLQGDTALAIGNILGSNIANLGLVMGISGTLAVIKFDREIHNRDGYFMLVVVALFYVLALDGVLSLWEGVAFVWLFAAYLLYLIITKKKFRYEFRFRQYLSEFIGLRGKEFVPRFDRAFFAGVARYAHREVLAGVFYEIRRNLTVISDVLSQQMATVKYFIVQALLFSVGVVAVIVGADFLVKSATALPIPELVVGLVLISVGTSLPELAVAVSAVRKNYPNIMIGNVIGSNIANILMVAGISAIAGPLAIPGISLKLHFPFLFMLTWLFLVFSKNDYKITRIESFTFMLMYLGFVAFAFMGFPG